MSSKARQPPVAPPRGVTLTYESSKGEIITCSATSEKVWKRSPVDKQEEKQCLETIDNSSSTRGPTSMECFVTCRRQNLNYLSFYLYFRLFKIRDFRLSFPVYNANCFISLIVYYTFIYNLVMLTHIIVQLTITIEVWYWGCRNFARWGRYRDIFIRLFPPISFH